MTPFGPDFLSTAPRWLDSASRARPVVVRLKTASRPTVIRASMGAVPSVMLTMAVIGAISIGVPPTASQATGGLATAEITVKSRSAAEMAWSSYLSQLETPTGRFSSAQIRAVRTVWDHFQSLNPGLGPPQAAPTPDGTLTMVWDSSAHHLEVDVDDQRKVGFFYSERTTGRYEAKDGSLAEHLPRRLDEIVKLFS